MTTPVVVRSSARRILFGAAVPLVVVNGGVLTLGVLHLWSGSTGVLTLAFVGAWLAALLDLAVVLRVVLTRGTDLSFGTRGVRIRGHRDEIAYPEVGLVLTWTVDMGDIDSVPRRYLAVVPRVAVPRVYAAPRPHRPWLGGPFGTRGAPPELDPYVVELTGAQNLNEMQILEEIRWRCPGAPIEHLGVVPAFRGTTV